MKSAAMRFLAALGIASALVMSVTSVSFAQRNPTASPTTTVRVRKRRRIAEDRSGLLTRSCAVRLVTNGTRLNAGPRLS
jgi:hypothetical protein